MAEPFRANLARVARDTNAMAERAAQVAEFRKAWGRSLSMPVRNELIGMAGHLRDVAGNLEAIADDPLPRLIAESRSCGVEI